MIGRATSLHAVNTTVFMSVPARLSYHIARPVDQPLSLALGGVTG